MVVKPATFLRAALPLDPSAHPNLKIIQNGFCSAAGNELLRLYSGA